MAFETELANIVTQTDVVASTMTGAFVTADNVLPLILTEAFPDNTNVIKFAKSGSVRGVAGTESTAYTYAAGDELTDTSTTVTGTRKDSAQKLTVEAARFAGPMGSVERLAREAGLGLNRLAAEELKTLFSSIANSVTATTVLTVDDLYDAQYTVRSNVLGAGSNTLVAMLDYKGVNEVIYQENGVTIRSIPAVHTADGAVSFILEWNGLRFAYSSDTFPNKWWIEHTKGVDLSVHESFASPQILLDKQRYRPEFALALSVFKHTSPQQFGKVMAMTEPRLAVGYHFYNDHDTLPLMLEEIRKTYDGPLALATDYMVFNVTKDDIRVRVAAIDQDIWPTNPTRPKETAPGVGDKFSDFTKSGKEPMSDLVERIYRDFNEENGTNVPLPK